MLYCHGTGCPLQEDCYRYTQPTPVRSQMVSLPFNFQQNSCEFFVSNIPTESQIRQAAYYIWLRQGKPEHMAEANWRDAYVSLCQSFGRRIEES